MAKQWHHFWQGERLPLPMKICRIKGPAISCQIFTSLSPVADIWDGLLPEAHRLRSPGLIALENSNLPDIEFAYLLVYQHNFPIGLIYFQKINFNQSHYNHSILEREDLSLIKKMILKQKADILICGNLYHNDSPGFYFKNEGDQDLVPNLIQQFKKSNPWKSTFCATMLKDIEIPFAPDSLKKVGFKSYTEDVLMELDLREEWKSFDDYLSALSKKYVQRAGKIRMAGKKLIRKMLSLTEIEQNASCLEKLYLQIAQKQKVRIGKLSAGYFAEMKRAYQSDFELIAYFDDATIVAFASYFMRDNRSLEIHYIGLDYARNDSFKLYFNILFDGIEMAIQRKCSSVLFGRTSEDAKASAGAHAKHPLHYIHLKLGLPAFIFHYLQKWHSQNQSTTWKSRNPFKERAIPELLLA